MAYSNLCFERSRYTIRQRIEWVYNRLFQAIQTLSPFYTQKIAIPLGRKQDFNTDCDASNVEKENTQELLSGPPTCCSNKAQISEISLGQMSRGVVSQLCCPPAGFAAVCEVSCYTVTTADRLKANTIRPYLHVSVAKRAQQWHRHTPRLGSLLTGASQGWKGVEEKRKGKFSHIEQQEYGCKHAQRHMLYKSLRAGGFHGWVLRCHACIDN